jgi:hypothetical protein
MRDSTPLLESVINAGVRTVLYDGDAVSHLVSVHPVPINMADCMYIQDFICNFKGVEQMVSLDP